VARPFEEGKPREREASAHGARAASDHRFPRSGAGEQEVKTGGSLIVAIRNLGHDLL
jgi:hypothetical protein